MVDFEVENADESVSITGTVTGDAILTNNAETSTVQFVSL